MSSEPYVPGRGTVRYRYVEGDYSGGNRDPHAEFDRFIAKVRADTLREFAAKDIPAAVEARRTLLAEADRIEQEARDGR
ncbi:hypothetical protein ACMZ29_16410 [Brevibacterium casei]|uniref:hypothetical protein n=1 Tax=Brevibacterium casei TaxID=33889 RepID=UPI0039EF365E